MNSIRTVSRKQGHFREELSGGSWSAKPGAYEQECDRRLSSRDELAKDDDVHVGAEQGKSQGCPGKVNTLIRGDLSAKQSGVF